MSDRPTVQQLVYFLAAVEHRSFAAAAEHLYIAQPSLSAAVRQLERTLGVVLFTRTNRSLQLTDAGRLLVPWAEKVVTDVDDLTAAVRDVRELAGGTVAFGTFSSAHLYLLPAVTAEFHRRYPGVRIRVLGLNSAEVADAVRAGDLEAGLVQLPIDDRGLWVSAPVLTDSVVYVSADPERTREPVDVGRLAAAPLILSEARWARDDPLRRALTERAQRAGVTLRPTFEVEFQTAAVEMAAHGVGDSLVSYLVTRWKGYPAGLHWAPLDPVFDEHFALVTRQSGALSPATRAFMTLAEHHIRALQDVADAGRQPT
ncbi:LysR family transcriptional regulator [Virgisporangium ochraceum]|uniref:LysR family transcriptional regulator n=1 Tax=Virgisporangium ochraceum TaxID=65505 RepID=A0A8J3ZW73_9ACTN|nr:LysR family transcriptional regulator [Virgisporangium ochraceum]GIJ71114.1 LysR family transcriptional regulator [Virgisporangium ochraceum]